ncbi:PHP domain-containing protein [Treponema sp. UBA3813]|uniref:PHP domain-containing protein n=1 Tax=Treponema sp. UBA3813 TaxID=1947715 RepID=UPI0025F37C7C|nr:PHP domain-containing protein [Treponema sp. UBA3813]
MIDLHSHSSASDGIFSPKEAAEYAIGKKLKVWALTDHDTVDGLYEAAKTCAQSESQIIFLPGIEINVRWPSGEFHLLGMGLRRYSQDLKDLVADLTEYRRNRNQEIVDKMNLDGIEVTLEEIEGLFAESQIGRPHFASYLMKIGKVKHRQEAFDRFLGKGRPYYATHEGADLDVAVEAIRSAGGVPVLAHPLSLYVSWGKMDETIEKIKNHGVEGLEAWHPAARINEGFKLEQLAKKLGMFVTAGSDFHGKGVRADRHLGKTSGDRKIEDRFYFEELLPHLGDFNWRETEWCKSNA